MGPGEENELRMTYGLELGKKSQITETEMGQGKTNKFYMTNETQGECEAPGQGEWAVLTKPGDTVEGRYSCRGMRKRIDQ